MANKIIDLNLLYPEPMRSDVKRGPTPKQNEFTNKILDPNGPKFVGYYGGYGSGKTLTLCVNMIIQGILFGGEYVIARQNMPELRRTTMKQFLELVPRELLLEHRVADAEVHIKSSKGKAVFYFVGVEEPGKLDSLNLSGFAIDESSYTSEEAFIKLQGRLRNPKGLRKGIIVGNPKGRNWVYKRFVSKQNLQEVPGIYTLEEVRSQYNMIVAPSTENPHLPEGYVEAMLASYSKERINRDIYGSFDSFEGMIYTEFDRATHVVKPFKIPEDWPRYIGVDHGFRNPSAWVFGAVSPDGEIYIYDEFYKSEWTIPEIINGKRDEEGKLVEGGVMHKIGKQAIVEARIDPSTKANKGRTNSKGEAVSDYTIYVDELPDGFPLMLANNSVSTGIDRVKGYLKVDEKVGRPRCFIFDTCTHLLDEAGEYRWKELSAGRQGHENEKEEPHKHNDHAMDAWRYLMMSQPEPHEDIDDWYHKHNVAKDSTAARLHEDLEKLRNPVVATDPFGDGI